MKRYLLSLSVILLATTHHATAQNIHKQDSLLTGWVNDLARYSTLPCNAIKQAEQDSALRLIWVRIDTTKLMRAKTFAGEDAYALDSATLSYVLQERIKPELLK